MKSIGIRELRQRASEILRLVQRGESFDVTDHNRPVARLVPRRGFDSLQALVEAGEITPHSKTLEDLSPPLKRGSKKRASKTLEKLRAHER